MSKIKTMTYRGERLIWRDGMWWFPCQAFYIPTIKEAKKKKGGMMKVEIEIEPREVRFLIERSDACNPDYRKRLLDSWKRYDRKGRAKRKEILILLRIVDQLVRGYEGKKVASDVL